MNPRSLRAFRIITAGLIVGLLGLSAVPFTGHLEENAGLDLLFELRGSRSPPPDVLIISMDKESAEALSVPAAPEKWPRFLHALLTEKLAEMGAAVIGFDIFFHEARSQEHDELFAAAIEKAGNVVLFQYLQKDTVSYEERARPPRKGSLSIERVIPPVPCLAESALALALFPLPKVPVRVSQCWIVKEEAGDAPTLPAVMFQIFALNVYPEFRRLLSIAVPPEASRLPVDVETIVSEKQVENLIRTFREIFRNYPGLAESLIDEVESARLEERKKRLLKSLVKMYEGGNSRFLNFYGPPGTFKTLPYHVLLKETPPGEKIDLRGKAVFVGLSERFRPEQKDGFYTSFSQPDGVYISGVEIAATAFGNLFEDSPVRALDFSYGSLLIFSWGFLAGTLCFSSPALIGVCAAVAWGVLYLFSAHYLFGSWNLWLPLAPSLIVQLPIACFGSVAWKYREAGAERRNIRKAFGYFLPENVVDQLAKDHRDTKLLGRKVYGTCLFTDADQYAATSETLDPEELHRFINNYYEVIFEQVRRHGGLVSDIKGDSMLAVWAAETPDPQMKMRSCLAAIDIADAVDRYNRHSPALMLPTRIGLHSGYMVLGNVGGLDHYEYRPVGDIVNTASRIEELNKLLGTTMLVSKEVVSDLDGFLTRDLGLFLFPGKRTPVSVFELMGPREGSDKDRQALCILFREGLNAFRRQFWEEAIRKFESSLGIVHNDGPSRFYLKQCHEFRTRDPASPWEALISIEKKGFQKSDR